MCAGAALMVRHAFKLVSGGFKMIRPTNEKAPGAINTEGLDTDTTNDLNFATGKRHSKAIAAARIAGKSDAEIRELVKVLHAKRTELATV